jgi:hypothetical protein
LEPLLVLGLGALAMHDIEVLEILAYQCTFLLCFPEGHHLQTVTARGSMYAQEDEELDRAPEALGVGSPGYDKKRLAPREIHW